MMKLLKQLVAVIPRLDRGIHLSTHNNCTPSITIHLHPNTTPLQLSAGDKQKTIIVLVPTQDVLLTSVKLPTMNRARLLQALPYALEEQLLEDVTQLHFAIGEMGSDGMLPVAVVSQKKMTEWLALLQSEGVEAQVMLPNCLALPWQENQASVWLDGDMAVVRTGMLQGFACEPENLSAMMALSSSDPKLSPSNPELSSSNPKLSPSNPKLSPSNPELSSSNPKLSSSDPKLSSRGLTAGSTFILQNDMSDFETATNLPALNLLQGRYAKKLSLGDFINVKKTWRFAVVLGVACLVLSFLNPFISYVILKYQTYALERKISAIYKKHFPSAGSITASKVNMEEKLYTLSGEASRDTALRLLAYLADAKIKMPRIKVARFDFQQHQATLEIIASAKDAEDFSALLTREGLIVQQKNVGLAGEKIRTTLVVE